MAPDVRPGAAARQAVRAAARIDRARINARAGLVTALPVAGMIALGTLLHQPVGAVTVGAGAMLAGVAWRGTNAPPSPPLGTMVGASCAVALATLTGTLSGGVAWLHLVLLALFCLNAGLASSLGRRGNLIGTQAVIAFIVFGRFPEPLTGALELAGLVLLGGGVQIAFSSLAARPPARRQQRAAVSAAYRALAELAAMPGAPSAGVAAALDEAEARLAVPALLADPALMALSQLVEVGRRIRLELITLGAAVEPGAQIDPDRVAARLAALAGQLGGAARLAEDRRRSAGGRLSGRPNRGQWHPVAGVRSDLRRLRAVATLDSPAGRHALRLAVVVPATELLIQRVALPRAYWAVVAAATVLRPEFSATITRGVERVGGTFAGVVLATLIAVGLDPHGWGIAAIVGLLAWGTYTVFPASFAAGVAGLTGIVVFLLHAVAPGTVALALDRGIDTMIGGAIGLLAYALWPTWSGTAVAPLLVRLVAAQRIYLQAVLGRLTAGRGLEDAALRPLARAARTAYADAEAVVTLAQSEPPRGGDPHAAAATLAGLRRIVYDIHALRVEAPDPHGRRPRPELAPVARGLGMALAGLEQRLRDPQAVVRFPPLRELAPDDGADAGDPVPAALDELVDAVDTVAASLGIPLP